MNHPARFLVCTQHLSIFVRESFFSFFPQTCCDKYLKRHVSTPMGCSAKAVCRVERRAIDHSLTITAQSPEVVIDERFSQDILQNGSESINKIIIRKIVISIPGAAAKK